MYTVASPGCLFTFHSFISDLETSWNLFFYLLIYNSIWEENQGLILVVTHICRSGSEGGRDGKTSERERRAFYLTHFLILSYLV